MVGATDTDGIGKGAQILLYVNDAGTDHHRQHVVDRSGHRCGQHLLHDHAEPGERRRDVHAALNIWHASTASDDDTATLTLANASL